jgi:8-oxo-dGTP diphosphatase
MTIIVDVANVMGARADGWWKDRAGAALRLCREVTALARQGVAVSDLPPGVTERAEADLAEVEEGGRVRPKWVLVLEGRARQAADFLSIQDQSSEAALFLGDSDRLARLVLAAGSGDDAIVEAARGLRGHTLVVTADRELRRRCGQVGADTAGPGWLLRLL